MQAKHLRNVALSVAAGLILVPVPAHGQQAHWGSPDDKTVQYIVGMERRWAEGVCIDNGVVAGLLAEDFQGTSPKGLRFTKADELRDEKAPTSPMIVDSTRRKCASLETASPLSTAENTPWVRTKAARRQGCARRGPIRG